jgi:hypothetical protein
MLLQRGYSLGERSTSDRGPLHQNLFPTFKDSLGFGDGMPFHLTIERRCSDFTRECKHMRLRQTRIRLSFLLLLLAVAPGASAGTVYDAAGDFSLTSNPNGVWSYGTTGMTLTGPLTLFTATAINVGAPFVDGWVGTELPFGPGSIPFPEVAKNTTGSTQSANDVVVLHYELTEHPSNTGAYAIVRFTAPTSGVFQVNTTFEGRETFPTSTDVHVLLNGSSLFDGAVVGFGPPSDQSFAMSLNLNAGDHLDFAVGWGNGTFFGDTTALAATISAVPEPSSAVLFGFAALAGLVLRAIEARRRSG